VDTYLAYRQGVCEQIRMVEGQCPDGPGEVALGVDPATSLGAQVGDEVTVNGVRLPDPITLRVAGIYDIVDPYGLYWTGTELLGGTATQTTQIPSPALVSWETLLAADPEGLQVDAHVVVPDSAFSDPSVDLEAMLGLATAALRQDGIDLRSSAGTLVQRIDRDRLLVVVGVSVGAAQLVLICWVGLFLAVRHTSEGRRGDIGLLKLRGTAPWRVWALTAQQSGLPMLAGTLLGAVLGFAAAAALTSAGTGLLDTASIEPTTMLWLSIAAALLAGLGGLVVAVVAERRTIQAPVVDLLRRVPGQHRGWRADIADLVVVALAVAGVYQGQLDVRSGREASVFALLAPVLVGLAVALLVARALLPLAARIGTAALRSGRPGVALAAMHLARRDGTQRVFAVMVVAVAVFTTSTMFWQAATVAWSQRAVAELGADRVLRVEAAGASALLAAVRSADPDGRYAMAVARTDGLRTDNRMIAVDTTRLAHVGLVPDGMRSPAELADLLGAKVNESPTFVDGPVTVDAHLVEPSEVDTPVRLRLNLSTVDGQAQTVELSLAPGRAMTSGTVAGCGEGCRLASMDIATGAPDRAGADEPGRASVGVPVTVELYGLSQPDGAAVGGDVLADVTRWRTSLVHDVLTPTFATSDDHLTISVRPPAEGQFADTRVLPLDAPVPLPVVLAGAPPLGGGGDLRVKVLGATEVPFRVVAEVPALPRLGATGVMVDLEHALHTNDLLRELVELEVWLAADAPAALTGALAEQGVRVLAEQSVAGRTSDLAGYGPGLALRFGYFAMALVLLLAAGVAIVGSTVDRSGRVAELVALRGQGLTVRAVRAAGYAGSAVLLGGALVAGMAAAVLAQLLVAAGLPVFSDDWSLLPVPSGLSVLSLAIAAGAVLLVLGVAILTTAARLVSAVTGASRSDRGAAS
jgi:hypothetical protein